MGGAALSCPGVLSDLPSSLPAVQVALRGFCVEGSPAKWPSNQQGG